MLGRSGGDFLPADLAATFEASERQVLETGERYEVEEDFEFDGIGRSRIVRKNRVSMESGKDYIACFVFDITEMKRRETEAEEARQHLANVLEALPAGVIIYDSDDNFVFANRMLQDSLPALKPTWKPGHTFREALELGHSAGYFRSSGEPELDAIYDTDFDRWIEGMVAHYHRPHSVFERRNPDGRWFKVFDMRTDDGTFIGVRTDISEIKEREKALRKSMRKIELFRHVLDELPVATYVKSADLAFEFVNKAWTDITGISKEQASGQTDRDFFVGEGEGFAERDLDVLRTGVTNETEETLTHTDGTSRQLIAKKSRLIASDGSVHLIGSSTDITEMKSREVRLQESLRENEIFRSLIDNVPVAIYAKRDDLKLFYVNKYWTQLTGMPSEEAVGKTDFEVSGENGLAFMESDRAILRTGQSQEIEETVENADGSMRYQMARKGSLVASDGSLYLLGSTIDVTDQKEREKLLQEAQRRAVLADRAKSEFLANMSHEIRTPMNGVLGMAELLAKSDLDPKQKTFTDIIVKSGNALLTIINDILDFSKIDAGQLVLDPAPFKLAEAIEDVATLISTRAKEKDLELIVRIEPGLGDIYIGDVGRVRQIITNLIGNAVKFTDSGHVLVDVSGVAGRRQHPAADIGDRHRHRHSGRQTRRGVREIQPGRRVVDAPARGHRPWARDHLAPRRADGRRDRRRQHGRQGIDLLVHGDPAERRTFRTPPGHAFRRHRRAHSRGRRQSGEPRDPDRADGVLDIRCLRGRKRRRGPEGADGGRRLRAIGRLHRARLPDARHDRRRNGADPARHRGGRSHADRHAYVGRPVAVQFELSRPLYRRAADQADAVLGPARNAGIDDPETPFAQGRTVRLGFQGRGRGSGRRRGRCGPACSGRRTARPFR